MATSGLLPGICIRCRALLGPDKWKSVCFFCEAKWPKLKKWRESSLENPRRHPASSKGDDVGLLSTSLYHWSSFVWLRRVISCSHPTKCHLTGWRADPQENMRKLIVWLRNSQSCYSLTQENNEIAGVNLNICWAYGCSFKHKTLANSTKYYINRASFCVKLVTCII